MKTLAGRIKKWGTHFCIQACIQGTGAGGGRDTGYFGRKIGKKSSVWRYTRCSCSGIAPMAKRVVPMDSPGRQLLVSRSSEPFDFFQACLATRASLLGFEKLGPRRGKYGGKSVKSSVWRYTRCGCSGIAPIAKRVVPMDSPGRQLRVSRSSEPFDFFFRLAWLPEEACLASSSLDLGDFSVF